MSEDKEILLIFGFPPYSKSISLSQKSFQQLKPIPSAPIKVQESLSLVLQSPSDAGVTLDRSAVQGHLCGASQVFLALVPVEAGGSASEAPLR